MNAYDRNNIQSTITKIQSDNFNHFDVEHLFSSLREYSQGFPLFREFGDLLAHKKRDRGLVNESLRYIYLNIRFLREYNSKLHIDKPFPIWIKELMILQVQKSNESILILKFNVSKKALLDHINKSFKNVKKTKMTVLNKKMLPDILEALNYILSSMRANVVFTQEQLIDDVVEVIKLNDFTINNDFLNESNYFTLCTLLLFHNRKLDIKGHKLGHSNIRTELKPEEGLVAKLELHGTVWIERPVGDATVSFSIMSTNLDIDTWCDEGINLERDIIMSDSRKLTNIIPPTT